MIASLIARELDLPEGAVASAIALLDEGNTVPFIARYRKEKTGGLDDGNLREIEERLRYLRELEDRKQVILKAIEEQGKLTPLLRQLIEESETKARLEDLYLPYKKRRRTKADAAREAGLEPAADALLDNAEADLSEWVCVEYPDAQAVWTGARDIVADRWATDADLIEKVRFTMFEQGEICSHTVDDPTGKFADYADFAEPNVEIPSHRILALFRGEKEGALRVRCEPGEDALYHQLVADTVGVDLRNRFVADAVAWAWRTKLEVSGGLDVRMRLKERADADALEVFRRNLRDVLLAAPAGQRATLGLDPGYRNGVKCAVVDATGRVRATKVVYPHQPQRRWDEAVATLTALCHEHGVELVAVGNGTASRETEKLARELPAVPVVVSESGASIYSASSIAAAEFPDMDVALRGAVSIARRLQDPLAELVKIDPKSIGVGQYQHDVNQQALAACLDAVVEDAVNAVGVDVNTASAPLLERVAGITPTLAKNIVARREENGEFVSRTALLDVPRLGPKAFEQCAGFLRIRGHDPLDASAVHPESYAIVRRMSESTGLSVEELIGNTRVLKRLRPADFVDDTCGEPTVRDIIAELDKPGRDPRPEFRTARFKEGVESIEDLREGMVLEGTVTNVAAFGAFVDVGVHQDGLVHISELADRFVRDPHEVVRSGQVVTVTVLDVDTKRRRISLSMR